MCGLDKLNPMLCHSCAFIWHVSSYRLMGHLEHGICKLCFCGVLTCLVNLAKPKEFWIPKQWNLIPRENLTALERFLCTVM